MVLSQTNVSSNVGTNTPTSSRQEGVVYDASGKPKSYMSGGQQITVGSKSDTAQAQQKAGVSIGEQYSQNQTTPNEAFKPVEEKQPVTGTSGYGPLRPEVISQINKQQEQTQTLVRRNIQAEQQLASITRPEVRLAQQAKAQSEARQTLQDVTKVQIKPLPKEQTFKEKVEKTLIQKENILTSRQGYQEAVKSAETFVQKTGEVIGRTDFSKMQDVGVLAKFGYGAEKAVVGIVKNPITGIVTPILHPVETVKGVGKGLVTSPEETLGSLAASSLLFESLVPEKIIKIKNPVVLEEVGNVKVLGVEFFDKGYPLVSKKIGELKFEIGTPKEVMGKIEFVEGKETVLPINQPSSFVGTKVFTSNVETLITKPTEMLVEGKVISPELQREFVVKGVESLQELKNVKTQVISPESFKNLGTKTLSPVEASTIFKYVGESKGQLFGSYPTRGQLKPELQREIGDIEALYKTSSESELKVITESALFNLQRVSPKEKFRIVHEEPFHIEKMIGGKFEKVVEFKGKGIGEGDVAPEKAFGLELFSGKDFMKYQGTTIAALRGELKRKTAASISIRESEALGVAHTGRFKDVPDLFRITEQLKETKKTPSPKAEEFLKLSKELGVEYKKEPLKLEITKEVSKTKSPSVILTSVKVSPITSFKSPSVRSSVRSSISSSPKFSPSISPSYSPSISPSVKSPNFSPSVRSPSPSIKSPYQSPYSPKSPSISSPSSRGIPSPSITQSFKQPNKSITSFFDKKNNIKQEGFVVEIGRKGKTKLYKQQRFGSLYEAESFLKGELKSTLAASGTIKTTSGQSVMVNLGEEFTPSKKEVGRVVQKAKYRLSSGGEKAQIRGFRI